MPTIFYRIPDDDKRAPGYRRAYYPTGSQMQEVADRSGALLPPADGELPPGVRIYDETGVFIQEASPPPDAAPVEEDAPEELPEAPEPETKPDAEPKKTGSGKGRQRRKGS